MTYITNKQQPVNEQDLAPAELAQYINQQAEAIAPEEYTSIEISFYDHEIYVGQKLVAAITYDEDLSQPWVVMINGEEIYRANTWAKCYRYICTHHKDGSLPVQEPEAPAATTENEIMAQITNACDQYGLELLDNGVYRNDVKLGEIGCTDGNWWFIRAGESQEKVPCDSVTDAVYWISMVDTVEFEVVNYEQLLNLPFDQLTSVQWELLLKYEPEYRELVAA